MRLFLIFLFIATIAWAKVGHVVMVDGDVIIDRENIQLNARKGMKLEQSDVITTIGKSKVQLKFLDNTLVNLGKDSAFNIEEFFMSEQKNDIKANFSISKGAFKIATGLISKVSPKKFQLKSRTATIGIRGTEIVGKVSDTADIIACTSGLIAVGAIGVDVEPVLVKAGMMTEVMPGVVPSKPQEFSVSDLKSLIGDVGEIIIKEDGDKEEEPAAEEAGEEETAEDTEETEEAVEETASEMAAAVEEVAAEEAAPLALPESDTESVSDIATQSAQETIEVVTAEQSEPAVRVGGWKGFTAAYIGSDPATGSYIFGRNDNPEDFWIGEGSTAGSVEAMLKIKTPCGIEYSLTAQGEEYLSSEYGITYLYAVGDGGWLDSPGYSSEGLDNYDYLTWGEWAAFDVSYESGEQGWWNGWWGHWIAGDMTPEYDIPQSGTAYYAGEVRGEVYYTDGAYPGQFDYITGRSSFDVDFGAKSLSGTLNMDVNGDTWKTAALTGSWSSGSQVITGGLSTSAGDTGDVTAAFFGPAAQELGGSWNLDAGTSKAVGTFSAKQSTPPSYSVMP